MFVSVEHLHRDMGVDKEMARFFVDRKVPADNAFWRKRLLYIGRGTGFVSIPVYYDILLRIGVQKEILLKESHVRLMENVMHFAILHEYREITYQQQLEKTKELFSGRPCNNLLLEQLLSYLEQDPLKPMGRFGLQNPALNRADAFLFILCDLPLQPKQVEDAITFWYALHPSYLLMDDIVDLKSDEKEGEENSLLFYGSGGAGMDKAFTLLDENASVLHKINPVLSGYFLYTVSKIKRMITENKI